MSGQLDVRGLPRKSLGGVLSTNKMETKIGITVEDAEQPAGGSEKDIVLAGWQQLRQSWRTVAVADATVFTG